MLFSSSNIYRYEIFLLIPYNFINLSLFVKYDDFFKCKLWLITISKVSFIIFFLFDLFVYDEPNNPWKLIIELIRSIILSKLLIDVLNFSYSGKSSKGASTWTENVTYVWVVLSNEPSCI